MEDSKIKRINQLAKKAKAEGLSPEEAAEQKALRVEYVAAFRASLTAQLESTRILDADGKERKIQRKNPVS